MKCLSHNNEATIICPSCGKGLCSECTVVSDTARNACSEECMRNLKTLDEATNLTLAKTKNSLKANIAFGRFLGIVFVLVGIIPLIVYGKGYAFLSVFLVIMGVAFIIGAQIYVSALQKK